MKKYSIFLFTLLIANLIFAQENLSKNKAVEITLENNYDIQVSNNNVKIAENNASIYNSGFLPTLDASTSAGYSDNKNEISYQDGNFLENKTQVNNYNANVGVGYLLFNGLGRKYNYKRFQELYNLSEIQAQQVIELTLLGLLTSYYEVARLTENKVNQFKSLEISKDRLLREKYKYEFGQNTQLDVLNSEVDINNDSIAYLDIERQLANTKRDLNLIMGRDVNSPFEVDTIVNYEIALNYDELLASAKEKNVLLQQAEKSVAISDLDIKINRSGWLPTVAANGGLNWNNNHFNADTFNAFSLKSQNVTGFSGGVSLNWNIFDGGRTKVLVQNAKIAAENSLVQKEQIEKELERNMANAWETYQNALFILQAEQKNVETNKRNFSRSEEQFKLGQIISVEFRLAQVNLLNAINNYNRAKYAAKIAELTVLQLSGKLLGAIY
ncbi:TolC family protein [Namhaeicola litoreus]|uniref:TolC family protein n=1 Tax=Namhaeicola litoreus TaxID=1052145 RepID=A0ABW3Y3Q4_9FLAO